MSADFHCELRRLRTERGLSIRALAALVHHGKSYLHELETGQKVPSTAVARRLDQALAAGGRLAAALRSTIAVDTEPEIEALELVQRITASDVSHETLDRLELAADRMAMSYATIAPADLLPHAARGRVSADPGIRGQRTVPDGWRT